MTYYVNMNDTFMSGWGGAVNGRQIYSVECENFAQAEAIEKAAHERSEMKRIAIADKPRRGRAGDHVSIKKFSELGDIWTKYYYIHKEA